MAAISDSAGTEVEVMVDCHSFFDVALVQSIARRLEPYNLTWYEEPVAPEKVDETPAIHRLICQPVAGGEFLFGVEGFAPLCRNRAEEGSISVPEEAGFGIMLNEKHVKKNRL